MFEVLEYMLANEQANEEALKIFSLEQLEHIQEALEHAKQLVPLYKTKNKNEKLSKKKKAALFNKESKSLAVINRLSGEPGSPLVIINQLILTGINIEAKCEILDIVGSIITLLVGNTNNNLKLFNNIFSSLQLSEKTKRKLSEAEVLIRLALEPEPLSTILTPSGGIRMEANKPVATYLRSHSIDHLSGRISLNEKSNYHSPQFFIPHDVESFQVDLEELKNLKVQLYILDQTFLLLYEFCNKEKNNEIPDIYFSFFEDHAELKRFLSIWHKILRFRPKEYPVVAREFKNFFKDVVTIDEGSLSLQIEPEETTIKKITHKIQALIGEEISFSEGKEELNHQLAQNFNDLVTELKTFFKTKSALTVQERALSAEAGHLYSRCPNLYEHSKNLLGQDSNALSRYLTAIQYYFNALPSSNTSNLSDRDKRTFLGVVNGLALLYTQNIEDFNLALECLNEKHHLNAGEFKHKLQNRILKQCDTIDTLIASLNQTSLYEFNPENIKNFIEFFEDESPSLRY